jgi:hypothetical protein
LRHPLFAIIAAPSAQERTESGLHTRGNDDFFNGIGADWGYSLDGPVSDPFDVYKPKAAWQVAPYGRIEARRLISAHLLPDRRRFSPINVLTAKRRLSSIRYGLVKLVRSYVDTRHLV